MSSSSLVEARSRSRRTLAVSYGIRTLSLTPDNRQRPLHDEDMTGGSQPANFRVINRRFSDPASNNELEVINGYTSFKTKQTKEGGQSFFS
jgi:hypothetical protein